MSDSRSAGEASQSLVSPASIRIVYREFPYQSFPFRVGVMPGGLSYYGDGRTTYSGVASRLREDSPSGGIIRVYV